MSNYRTDNLVSVEPLRDRFLRMRASGEVTAQSLARDLGWYREASPSSHQTGLIPDGQRVRRTLGVAGHSCRGGSYYRQRINYELAERFARALNLDPWEVGI